MPPSWDTELRELAPNVYAHVQAGGPGRNNVSVSDAGVIVGDDGVMVIDSTTAPMHAKAMVAAIRKVTDNPFVIRSTPVITGITSTAFSTSPELRSSDTPIAAKKC